MNTSMKIFVLLFFTFFSISLIAQKDEIQVTDLLIIKTTNAPVYSPDKQHVLFQLNGTRVSSENSNEFENTSSLLLYSLINRSLHTLTDERKNVSSPKFSPDGHYISFIRTENGKTQLYLMDRKGGEAFSIGKDQFPVQSYVWSKDSKSIYFTSSFGLQKLVNDTLLNSKKVLPDVNLEKPGFATYSFLKKESVKSNPNGSINEIRAYLQQNETDKKAKVFNKLNFQDETVTNAEIRTNLLFKIDLANSTNVELISPLFENWNEYQVSSDQQIIYAIRPVRKSIHPDKVLETEIIAFQVGSKTSKVLKSKEGIRYSNLILSPDDQKILFAESINGQVKNPAFYVTSIKDLNASKIIPIDRVLTQIQFNKESSQLFFTMQDHGGATLHSYQLATGEMKAIRSDVAEGILGFDENQNGFVYAKTKILNPFELYTFDGINEEQITHLNTEWLKNKFISIPEKHTFKNEKGLMVDYWVMKPKGFEKNKKYPLMLEIHGGPTAMWGTGELSMWHEFQYYAAKGYGIVYANPRGSGGYGSDFMAANVKDWGKGPMNDVMKALDLTIKEGWTDTTKLAVTGGSYAGYLVSYILGNSNRFKVACAQRGVYELSTFFGEGNAWRLVPNYFGGYPWDKNTKQLLDKESPLSYVKNIKTPLIIFHGEVDLRTGVIQSEMLYKSLKVLNREVEYVRHPGASHEITRSGNNRQRIDQMLRTYEYFSRFIP